MKGFEQHENNNDDVVGGWSLQQCEEYLSKHPRGPKSDRVHARKKQLLSADMMATSMESASIKQTDKPSKENNSQTTGHTNVSTSVSSSDINTKDKNTKKSDGWEVFGKVLLSIGALGIAFLLGYVVQLIFGFGPAIKYVVAGCGMALWNEIWDD